MPNESYTTANWNQPPHNRHSFQHVADLFATQTVAKKEAENEAEKGAKPHSFNYALDDLTGLVYQIYGGGTNTLGQFLDDTYTDAFLVLQDGAIVMEEYRNNMTAQTPHPVSYTHLTLPTIYSV